MKNLLYKILSSTSQVSIELLNDKTVVLDNEEHFFLARPISHIELINWCKLHKQRIGNQFPNVLIIHKQLIC